MARPFKHRRSALVEKGGLIGLGAFLVLASGACFGQLGPYDTGSSSGSGSGGSGGGPPVQFPFEAVSPRIYVAKVKDLLIGQAPTEDEITAVTKDPTALRGMVHAWFVTPAAQGKFFSFFQKAFQQTQITANDFLDQGRLPSALLQATTESFARTAQKLVDDGQPFTSTAKTHQFMMTPALMAQYLYIDQTLVDDSGKDSSSVPMPDGTLTTSFDGWLTYIPPPGLPITFAQMLDPTSPYFRHIPVPAAFNCSVPKVDATGHVVLDASMKPVMVSTPYNERHYGTTLGSFLGLFGHAAPDLGKDQPPAPMPPADVPANLAYLYKSSNCNGDVDFATTPLFTAADAVWRMVTVRPPMAGEKLTAFYDLPTLRASNELVMRMPRVGFFSTTAFLANWQTNQSNQARDTMNQTLIVSIGRSINPVDKGTSTVLDTGKDGSHSDPNSPCYSCHQTMDPMREVFRQAFTYNYHQQKDPSQVFATATFDFLGMKAPMASLDDLADTLVKHPLYAGAWVQKLCYYANSSRCSEDDPEFLRIAKTFVDSSFDFHALVSELFSSPIITGATTTKTWTDVGETVTIARQDHFCASLTNRLKLPSSVCASIANKNQAQAVANNIPLDGYLRGAEGPALSTDPTMFFRGAAETLCTIAAGLTVDQPMSLYSSMKKDQAVTDFVQNIMGLATGDPTSAEATQILQDHQAAAIAAGATPTEALKSTFVLACTSPTSLAIGL